MIVKDESHIIKETLTKLCDKISFDYWVISDTGSTDGTQDIIKTFFEGKGIPGELLQHEWKDFGHNRTLALEGAYQKADYLLVFDADDTIYGDFKLPDVLDADMYMLKFGQGLTYLRPLLMNARKRSKFVGVLHEFFTFCEPTGPSKTIEGDYYVDSGKSGSRSNDSNKYAKDAAILEKAYNEEQDKGLKNRYAFYCAQSYRDSNQHDKSIEWYSLVVDKLDSWTQEKYYACLMVGNMYKAKKEYFKALEYYLKADKFDNERKEGVIFACEILYEHQLFSLILALYEQHKNYNRTPADKLFLYSDAYNDRLDFNASISASFSNKIDLAYKISKEIIIRNIAPSNLMNAVYHNISLNPHQLIEDKDTLDLFYKITNVLPHIENPERLCVVWDILFKNNRKLLTKYSTIKKKNTPVKVFLSMTTCKRLDLFQETVNSILNHWTDVDMIDYWFCVDDNSSEEDRKIMKSKYSWFDFYMKTQKEKGHRPSMNIIWNKLKELKPKYWIHMEDDFLFYVKRSYVKDAIDFMDKQIVIKQVLFNREYAETMKDVKLRGYSPVSPGFVVHEFKQGQFSYPNCHYWPHYSFRPSVVDVQTILSLGNFDSKNTFFERDYADKWYQSGYKSAFFDAITCQHTGRLTSDKDTKTVKNAYDLNNETQFNQRLCLNKVINLKRRSDRKQAIEEEFKKHDFDDYVFTDAVDGKELKPTLEIKKLFSGNDFGYRCGVVGCALSHYNLWVELLNDPRVDYYVIFEDDIQLASNFKQKFKDLEDEFINRECLFLGYHMFSKNRDLLKDQYNTETDKNEVTGLNRNLYIGGTFAYSINKKGAKKLVDYIRANNIQNGIDYLMAKRCLELDACELKPQIVFSEWYEGVDENVDTDIQKNFESLDFTNVKDFLEEFDVYPGLDHFGDDIGCKKDTLQNMAELALNIKECVAFNSLGYFKCKVDLTKLNKPNCYSETDCLYVRKTGKMRIKMLCNWQNSEDLVKEWSVMGVPDNMRLVSSGFADYYVIINYPKSDGTIDSSKTIWYFMEPSCFTEKIKIDKTQFLHVNDHENYLNAVQYSFKVRDAPQTKKEKVSSILSSKYNDPGHKLRVDFIKQNEDLFEVFGKENTHSIATYVGPVPEENRSNVYLNYKYCLAVENHSEHNYATEKIWEPLLCETLPFYWGCPNLEDHIDPQSFVRLPLDNIEESRRIIQQAIDEDWWSQRIEVIRATKKKILTELAFFPRLSSIIEKSLDQTKQYRIKAKIMTLERNVDRVQTVQVLHRNLVNLKMDTEVIYGVDGKLIKNKGTTIEYNGFVKKYDKSKRHNGQLMKNGEFGCSWSHINMYEKLVKDEDCDAYLIFEDDAVLLKNLDVLKQLPPSFDVCQLCHSTWYPYEKTSRVNKSFYNIVKKYFNYAAAYVITKEGAQKILNYLDGHVNVPADDLLSNMFIENKIEIIIPEEPLFTMNSNLKSSAIW